MGDLGQIVPTKFDPHDRESIRDLVGHSNVVVNLMGIDYETRNWSFEQTHVELAATVAEEAARVGAERLVHVSALGADPASPSEFLASKGRGEAAVTAAFPDATILRPGTMVGNEDRLILRLANLAKKFRVGFDVCVYVCMCVFVCVCLLLLFFVLVNESGVISLI